MEQHFMWCGMDAVIFCGLQASGKTTYYTQNFLKSHLRISLDLMRSRYREQAFLHACLVTGMAFVIDNTNPDVAGRAAYISKARKYRYRVSGYFFHSLPAAAAARDKGRPPKEQIPLPGIYSTYKKLQPLRYAEGFDSLHWVELADSNFVVHEGEWHAAGE